MVVGPEVPLVAGLADKLEKESIHWYVLFHPFIVVSAPAPKRP